MKSNLTRYPPAPPRGILGLFAVAMALITMGVLVVLPEELEFACAQAPDRAIAASGPAVPIHPTGAPAAAGGGNESMRVGRGCSRAATPAPVGEATD